MKRLSILFTLLIALVFVSAQAHATNIIINGGFEVFEIKPGTFEIFNAIPGWMTTSGSGIEIQNNIVGSPFEGAQHVELDSDNNSGMAQTISTVAGQEYDLSFFYSARPGRASTTNGIDINWDGVNLSNITADGIGLSDTDWNLFAFSVIATGPSTLLEFVATGTSDSFGGYLDAVNLQAVPEPIPEPSTLLLFGSGLAALAGWRYRKRVNA